MQQANQLHREGKLADAEHAYRAVRAEDPRHFLATYNLGIIAIQTGRADEGETLIAEATRIDPSIIQAQLVHAKILTELKRFDEALKVYETTLQREPNNPGALNDRATVLLTANRHAEALGDLDRLLALQPEHPFGLYNRATALLGLRRLDDAMGTLDRLIAIKPDFADAMFFKGNLLRDLGRLAEAAEFYKRAIGVAPARFDFLNNYGSAFLDLKRHDDALDAFNRAHALQPKFIDILVNRGRTLGKLGRSDEEIADYDAALALNPQFAPALLSRGLALHGRRRFAEALAMFDQALAVAPQYDKVLQARAGTLMSLGRKEEALGNLDAALAISEDADALNNRGLVARLLSHFEQAAQSFTRLLTIAPDYPYAEGNRLSARLHCCDWTDLNKSISALSAGVAAKKPVANPFILLQISNDPQDLLDCGRQFIAHKYRKTGQPWTPGGRKTDRLRIAYLSSDLQSHATAYLAAGLFENHDRSKFEIIAVSFAPDDGTPMRKRLQAAFDQFIDVSLMTDDKVHAMLRALPVDIAVDLKGFTNDARPPIFLDRVAPLQVNYLGYPCTWASPCMDYIIADGRLIPPDHQKFYSEKIVALPDSYQVNDRKRVISKKIPTRTQLGLPENGIVFSCFNGNYKILPPVFDVWMRLLHRIPGSVMWILETNPAAARNLKREAAARGIAPDRIVFAELAQPEDHLARQQLADLFLDTLPVNAHTTAADALWGGLPVITCIGNTFAGRVAASLLHAAGLPELITHTLADYEALAYRLATEPGAIKALKAKLTANRMACALFDTARFTRNLEAAYVTMWERQMRGEPPESFSV